MRPSRILAAILLISPSLLSLRQAATPPLALAGGRAPRPVAATLPDYGRLPLSFEPNLGQADPRVRFLAHGAGYTLFLTDSGAVLARRVPQTGWSAPGHLRRFSPASRRQAQVLGLPGQLPAGIVTLSLAGANPHPRLQAGARLPGAVSYFLGNDARRWHAGIPTYARITYRDIYPGIDQVFYGQQGRVEYDFVLRPGASPAAIRLRIGGTVRTRPRLDARGNLVVPLLGGEVLQGAPLAYQQRGGHRAPVTARFRLQAGGQVALTVGSYDRTGTLVIDPTLAYATYLGGTAYDQGVGIAVDSSGAAYVTGSTGSNDFPLQSPYQSGYTFGGAVFVSKLNPMGTALLYSTYLGGNGGQNGSAIAVDAAGDAYITGSTVSSTYPTQSPLQAQKRGEFTGFVTKLNPTGSALVYSTYLGGSGHDLPLGIAVDGSGSAYVTGGTDSRDFPTQSALQAHLTGSQNAFVAKLNPAGSALVYSTYLGGGGIGTGKEHATSIAVDSGGAAYVAGVTNSQQFPTVGPIQAGLKGAQNAFVAKLNPAGTALMYSTYLGGSGTDSGSSIAVDGSGDAYITGSTTSADFPTQAPYQSNLKGTTNAFVTKLNPAGSGLVYSTYLGGSKSDSGYGIAVDAGGDAFIVGGATSPDYPTQFPFQASPRGAGDAFLTKLYVTGSVLLFSTYLGGSGLNSFFVDSGYGIAVDAAGDAFITGATYSTDFPTVSPYQGSLRGRYGNAFVAELPLAAFSQPPTPTATVTATPTASGTATVTPTPSATVTATASATATATAMPIIGATQTASSTPGSSFVPFSTPTPGLPPTATLTSTPSPVPVSLRLQLGAVALDQGQTLTATVRARPFNHLLFGASFGGLAGQISGTVRADHSGLAAIQFVLRSGPTGRAPSLPGLLTVRVTDPGLVGNAAARFVVYPALHLALQAHASRMRAGTVLAVTVQAARPGQVTVTATVPGTPPRRVVAHGSVAARHPLTMYLSLGMQRGHLAVGVALQVRTNEGVIEARSLSVTIQD